mmetsp:Transcript_13099/g.9153  ORF Transcript_13099/g.9153 Transcript_13099/m.9153 type:complete len:84 (+) Transcript_13099:237-488(+)
MRKSTIQAQAAMKKSALSAAKEDNEGGDEAEAAEVAEFFIPDLTSSKPIDEALDVMMKVSKKRKFKESVDVLYKLDVDPTQGN